MAPVCFANDISSTSGTTRVVWTIWADSGTTAAANGEIWEAWSSTTTTSATVTEGYRQCPVIEITHEEAQEYQRAQAEATERYRQEKEAREQKRRKADSCSRELLEMFLTPEQIQQLEAQSAFILLSELGKQYRIKKGRSMNIEELDDTGKPIARICAHPDEHVPDYDTMLAQKIMLETRETAFLALAHRAVIFQ